MYREYRAVITIFTPIRIIVMLDHEKVDITTNSSPIKLIVGVELSWLDLLVVIRWLLVEGAFVGLELELWFGCGFVRNLSLLDRKVWRM